MANQSAHSNKHWKREKRLDRTGNRKSRTALRHIFSFVSFGKQSTWEFENIYLFTGYLKFFFSSTQLERSVRFHSI